MVGLLIAGPLRNGGNQMEYEKHISNTVKNYLHENNITLTDAAIVQIIHYFENNLESEWNQYDEIIQTTSDSQLRELLSSYVKYKREGLDLLKARTNSTVFLLYIDYDDPDPILSGIYTSYELAHSMASILARDEYPFQIKKYRIISNASDPAYVEAKEHDFINGDLLGECDFRKTGHQVNVWSAEHPSVEKDTWNNLYMSLFETYQDFPHPFNPGDIVRRTSDGSICILDENCTLDALRARAKKLTALGSPYPGMAAFFVFEKETLTENDECRYQHSDEPEHPYGFDYLAEQ